MKIRIIILTLLLSNLSFSQIDKEIAFEKDIIELVEEMEFMYGYDQTLREYTIYKTFDKSETNRIENLPDSLKSKEISEISFESDSLTINIYKNYINPKDAQHTKRLIEITKEYGFPSLKRIKKYYTKEFIDPEFNPFIIFIHSPKKYWKEIENIMKVELDKGQISKCLWGYLLWHTNGRKSIQPMLDNGYELTEENGKRSLKPTCK
ncbi:MAG: hypothetical protein ACTH3E_00485 [Psychroflexus halocasei]